jgi:hypothetical protein
MNLTTLEADHLSLQERASRQILKLEKELEEKNKIVEFIDEAGLMVASSSSNSNSNSNKKDQVKELRSVVTQWVSNTVQKRQSDVHDGNTLSSTEEGSDDDENSPGANIAKQQMFESLRGKGSDLLEKIKLKGGEELEKIKEKNALPWQRKDKNGKAVSSPSDNTPSAKTAPKWDWDP